MEVGVDWWLLMHWIAKHHRELHVSYGEEEQMMLSVVPLYRGIHVFEPEPGKLLERLLTI